MCKYLQLIANIRGLFDMMYFCNLSNQEWNIIFPNNLLNFIVLA